MKTIDRSIVLAEDFKLGSDQAITPEGFLLCRNVPIARIGSQDYLNEELIEEGEDGLLIGGADGVIHVERRAEDVFSDATIRSFEGKPITDDHPDALISPETYREVTVGTVLNPRRGEGHLERYLIADLLIKDADAIAAVREGKREVSCGYDAAYESLAPGRARQHNIIGNHVALVEKGRCGPSCAIGDQSMAQTAVKKSLFDRAIEALRSGGEPALKGILTVDEEGISATPTNTIHIHNAGGPNESTTRTPTSTGDEEEMGEKKEKEPGWFSDYRKSNDDWKKSMEDRMGAMDARMKDEGKAEEEGEAESEGDVEDAFPDKEEEEGEKKEGKDKKRSMDAAGLKLLKDGYQAIVSGAEIIAPGLNIGTFDAKAKGSMGLRAAYDSAGCLIKRRALMAHAHTTDGASNIGQLTGKSKLDLKGMDCKEVALLFNGAVALATQDSMVVDLSGAGAARFGGKPVESIGAFNKAKNAYYAGKGAKA